MEDLLFKKMEQSRASMDVRIFPNTVRVPDAEATEMERKAESPLPFRVLGRFLLRASALLAAAAAGMEEAGRRMEGGRNGNP